MKILTIVGARPQFIKAAAVSREISRHKEIDEVIVHTGQHFDTNMSEIFFTEMEIPAPHYNLNINRLAHGAMTGLMLTGIEKITLNEKPNYVLVYGDTNSTLAGALAAKKLLCRVAHVEAGLRSFNMKMPEEINRILTDRISDVLLCPTDRAVTNLINEGFENFQCRIVKTGDVMYDAALYYSQYSHYRSHIIDTLELFGYPFILCTVHRQENTDDPGVLRSIIEALNTLHRQISVVVPLHPRTKNIIENHMIKTDFIISEPVGYFDMIELIKNCSLVITDSGGLQKEAFFFQKHCVTIRHETEWVELLDKGFNIAAGTEYDKIIDFAQKMMEKKSDFNIDLYGSGRASEKIVRELMSM
jgi:UDP-GlcNAc3NAcA epimerase